MKALTFTRFGSSDVLEYSRVDDSVLKPGEILVEMKAIGLNYADIMRRSGIYSLRVGLKDKIMRYMNWHCICLNGRGLIPLRNLVFETGWGQILRFLLSNCYSNVV